MKEFNLDNIRKIERSAEQLADVKAKIESEINLKGVDSNIRSIVLPGTVIERTCMLVGLSDKGERNVEDISNILTSRKNEPYPASFFNKSIIKRTITALIKMRYNELDLDLSSPAMLSKVLGYEMLRGRDILMKEGAVNEWLTYSPNKRSGNGTIEIPALDLRIGKYENGLDATLDMNSTNVANTQIVIGGSTGSGKSNLLALLINQLRKLSTDSAYPVNFLFFDYKGEFSDIANDSWLDLFDTDRKAILNPIDSPLPFNPFKDFEGKTINEVTLYATTLATALCAISKASISANMEARLQKAIVEAYKKNGLRAITFKKVYDSYTALQDDRDKEKMDSVKSVLDQIVTTHIFAEQDDINLVDDCYIIDLHKYPKEGAAAKAIVYFTISKLYGIYESLDQQEKNEERVQLRHFTIIDEAHHMLEFKNEPLEKLVAEGRNKGMSIILATQQMADYKNKQIDFLANAQYPIFMRQPSQNDQILKSLFGVSGNALNELKAELTNLQKGEVLMKDNMAALLGMDKPYKKILITKII